MKMFTLSQGRQVHTVLKEPAKSSTVEVRSGLYAGRLVRHLSDLELVNLSRDTFYSKAVACEIGIRARKVKMQATEYFKAVVSSITPNKSKAKKGK